MYYKIAIEKERAKEFSQIKMFSYPEIIKNKIN